MQNITNKEIIEYIKTMTALQLKELVELIEITFGVTSAATSNIPQTNIKEENKITTVSLILKEIGEKKVDVIKAVKSIIGSTISLIEAKKIIDLVATEPQKIIENIDMVKATEYKEILKSAGAIVEIK